MTPLSRRAVLLGGLSIGLAACARKTTGTITVSTAPQRPGGGLNLLSTSGDVAVGDDRRLAWVLRRDDGSFVAPSGPVTAAFGPESGRFEGPEVPAVVHTDTKGGPPYVTVSRSFSQPGIVWARVTADGKSAEAPVNVVTKVAGPIAGDRVPAVPTPTVADHQGVEPICTRDPACELHQLSLDKVVADRRRAAVLFSTPRYCQTATCGPVLEVLLDARAAGRGAVELIHVEIYQHPSDGGDVSRQTLAPAVQAFKLESEPVLFLVDTDGTVRDRVDGVFGTGEATAAMSRLAG